MMGRNWAVPYTVVLLLTAAFAYSDDPVEEWVVRYDGAENLDDTAYDMTLDSSGNVIVTGSSYSADSEYDYLTVKYDCNGVEQWARLYDGPAGSSDCSLAIAADGYGNVYVTGWSFGVSSSSDIATIKYDSSGTEEWVCRWDSFYGGIDAAVDIAVSYEGNVYVIGYTEDFMTDYDYVVIKYDKDGNQQWVKSYDGAASMYDEASAVGIDGAENVFATGTSYVDSLDLDYVTVTYNSSGSQTWMAVYDSTGFQDSPTDLAVGESGDVYVTGVSNLDAYQRDYLTVQYSNDGQLKWTARYDGTDSGTDYAEAIAVDDAGNVYVTGESEGVDTYYDFASVSYDLNGEQRWVARYNGPADDSDEAYDVAVDADGNSYVTGIITNTGDNEDCCTIKYDSDGNEQWVMIYDGPDHDTDEMVSVTVDAEGNVYAAGCSYGDQTAIDILVIKYNQNLGIGSQAAGRTDIKIISVFPNPSSGAFGLTYYVPDATWTSVRLYDVCGRLVQSTLPEEQDAGVHSARIYGLSNGLYFCRLESGCGAQTRSVVVLD